MLAARRKTADARAGKIVDSLKLMSKIFVRLLILFVAIVVCDDSQTVFAQSKDLNAVINGFIAQRAEAEHAEEYKKARSIKRGDLNGDGKPDAIVLYTLEGFDGGNNYRQYLTVFINRGNAFRRAANVVVGGKSLRSVGLLSVAKSKINLDTLEYTENDASCCPSKKAKAYLAFKNNKLSELKLLRRKAG